MTERLSNNKQFCNSSIKLKLFGKKLLTEINVAVIIAKQAKKPPRLIDI